jgi:hypothetical protein
MATVFQWNVSAKTYFGQECRRNQFSRDIGPLNRKRLIWSKIMSIKEKKAFWVKNIILTPIICQRTIVCASIQPEHHRQIFDVAF